MAVFRIEKNSDFTIMPNYPFRDMRLSFKGRGLLGTMLTLRDDWDYTLAGLTKISPHGKSYVSTGLNELERLGYLERRQLRDDQGRFIDTEYAMIFFLIRLCINNLPPIIRFADDFISVSA